MSKLRLMFNSNAIWANTGYGVQCRELLPALRDNGYDIAQLAYYGLEGGIIKLDDITIYPKINHPYGSDALPLHANHFKADVVFTSQDVWILDTRDLQRIKCFIPIVPIDHEPAPPIVLERLKYAYRIVSVSKFGHEELKRNGFNSTYIPYSVNTEAYKPTDKAEAKKKMGIDPNTFIFGMVAANKDNPPRKSFQEVMDAFQIFVTKHPNSALYIHTFVGQQGGFPIIEYAKRIGIADKLFYPNMYDLFVNATTENMAGLYNAMDCLVAPSTSEGFGVPIVEAQACGVPVITNNYTAMPELVIEGKTGYTVKVLAQRYSGMGSYVGIPDTEDIYNKMETVFAADRVQMGKDARVHSLQYDTKHVVTTYWLPFLEKLAVELKTEK